MRYLRIILPRDYGSFAMQVLKKHGAQGVHTIYGVGSVSGKNINFLELDHQKKEIVSALVTDEDSQKIFQEVEEKFRKKNTAIAFTSGGGESMDYVALYVIVDRKKGDEVVDLARELGARGATIIHGRGAGVEKKAFMAHMIIEPEKDIVLMLVKKDLAGQIKETIYKEMALSDPNKGIIFEMPVTDVMGLVDQDEK